MALTMKMAVDNDIDDDYDDDYGDDDDVGTLMNRIKQIYADFHKKNKSAESAQSAGSNPQLFQIDLNLCYKIGTKIRDN